MKKHYLGAVQIVFVLVVFILICFCSFNKISNDISSYIEERTKSKIVKEVVSPDGKYRALIIDNNYGATTYFSYQLLLLESDERITQNDKNIVFICDKMFDVNWLDKKIIITNYEGKVYKHVRSTKGIEIVAN